MSLLQLLQPAGKNRYRLPKMGEMQVEAMIYLDEVLLQESLDEDSVKQLRDAACLPGTYRAVLGMPDIHSGYGLPIGGVMATDAKTGVVSAGAVGMDINCGVRLLRTNIPAKEVTTKHLEQLVGAITRRVPTGIGTATPDRTWRGQVLQEVFVKGSRAVVEEGYGRPQDVEHTEENGCLRFANPDALSKRMRKRAVQLGTLGGGNHFLEAQRVEEVFSAPLAEALGLTAGNIVFMIHTGSRGFGHQICTEFSNLMAKEAPRHGLKLPNKGLAALPIDSELGQAYLGAMACAVNYAFANRQIITHAVRQAFAEVFGESDTRLGLEVVYDVAHNIAKFEEHEGRSLLVHRKGATRALPPGHKQNPAVYKETGHPALLPGSMGTSSYVVVGKPPVVETFCSVNHGAGRVMSRREARRSIGEEVFQQSMGDIITNADNYRQIVDEAPTAYKDIDRVVNVLADIGMVEKVARVVPLAVIKGSGE